MIRSANMISLNQKLRDTGPDGRKQGAAVSGQWLEGWTVILCIADAAETEFLRARIAEYGGVSIRVSRSAELAPLLREADMQPCMIMVEVTVQTRHDHLIDHCFDIRRAAPTSPVILMSRDILRDAFVLSRPEICDANLRIPATNSALEAELRLARTNNAIYCDQINVKFLHGVQQAAARPDARDLNVAEEDSVSSGRWLGIVMILAVLFWGALLWFLLS